MKVERLATDGLIPYARNAKKHDDAQVAQIAASIREFGFNNPVLIDQDNGIIAGHGRVLAARKLGLAEVPCIRLGHLTDTKRRDYIIADNRLTETGGGWDTELLALELEDLRLDDFDLDLTGFEAAALEEILGDGMGDAGSDLPEDTEPEIDRAEELRQKWGVETGQLWQLGEHRLLCGDSTRAEDVARVMGGEKAQLIHADPPYGMGKEKDGVENDNLYGDKLDAFQMQWWRAFRAHVDDNASAYIWGNAPNLWRLWYRGGLADSERMTIRNEIVWDKGSGLGQLSDSHRMIPTVTERCLFFMLGEQGFNNNADNYWDGWEPIRAYLKGELAKVGDIKWAKRAAGHSERSGCHWFDASQWTMPTEDVYKSWQSAAKGDAFKREYDELKREYDELKRDFYATRAYFDNTHDNMTDVWEFPRVTGDERHEHATPKPVAMIERAIKSSTPQGAVVAEPFSGSGTTLIACENLKRRCRAIEISPAYCAVALERWHQHTGQTPVLMA